MAGQTWPNLSNISTLRWYIFVVNISVNYRDITNYTQYLEDTECLLPEILMIKKSGNLIGQKCNQLLIWKFMDDIEALISIEFNYSFILDYFFCCQTTLRLTKFITGKFSLTGQAWPHPTSSSSLKYYLSLETISVQKTKDLECFHQQTLMIKESFSLIGREHLLVYNLKLCVLPWWEKSFTLIIS